MSQSTTTTASFPLGFFLFLVFLVLKLTDVIDWSWWWVTAPLWIPAAFALGFLVVAGLVAVIVALFSRK